MDDSMNSLTEYSAILLTHSFSTRINCPDFQRLTSPSRCLNIFTPMAVKQSLALAYTLYVQITCIPNIMGVELLSCGCGEITFMGFDEPQTIKYILTVDGFPIGGRAVVHVKVCLKMI